MLREVLQVELSVLWPTEMLHIEEFALRAIGSILIIEEFLRNFVESYRYHYNSRGILLWTKQNHM